MWQICIDTGGTFTDCIARSPQGATKRLKILSSSQLRGTITKQLDPTTFKASFQWGIENDIFKGFKITLLQTGQHATIDHINFKDNTITIKGPVKIGPEQEEFQISSGEEVPVLAARLLTQTALHDSFPPLDMRLGSTRGTNALLERKGAKVLFITTKGFKDLISIGNQQRPDLFALNIIKPVPLYQQVMEVNERIDAHGYALQPLDQDTLQNIELQLKEEPRDVSVAIAFINSYKNPDHELILQKLLADLGFKYISCSSTLSSSIKILPRAETTIANSYLLPIIKDYINGIEAHIHQGQLRIMTSAGAVVGAHLFTPKDSLLSGPAGGIVGAQATASLSGFNRLLTFDMGGTSTDVAVYHEGYDYRYETRVGDAHILSPSLSIETIAAGGGSVCTYDGSTLKVGPESAGAEPGPACYGAGGPLTITDINLLCGRLVENNFSIPIRKEAARKKLKEIATAMPPGEAAGNNDTGLLLSFLAIANEKMSEAIKKVSVRKGYKPSEYTLITFGGAGGQHACAIARLLDIDTILVPYDAGLLSAYGISQADIEAFAEKQVLVTLKSSLPKMLEYWASLEKEAHRHLVKEGFAHKEIIIKKRLAYLRYLGQENTVEIEVEDDTDYFQAFKKGYQNIYGHWIDNQEVEVESIKLIAAVSAHIPPTTDTTTYTTYTPEPVSTQNCLTKNGWKEAGTFIWEDLNSGAEISGPAIIVSQNCTVYVEAEWKYHLNKHNHAIITKFKAFKGNVMNLDNPEAAHIELFKNRFIGVVEEMGALLERTSFSVNVKERLDFSCALLDAQGELIVNAPHIPVHLGSMGICVRKVLEQLPIEEGDIIITNHPAYGGSHLPDITLISAVFYSGEVIGYVANRAHHAEIGGKTPGSMPTDATKLEEEGVIIEPQYLARRGKFLWNEIRTLLSGGIYPSRAIEENLADLQGGVAALQSGTHALQRLCQAHTGQEVKHYMALLKSYVNQQLWQQIRSKHLKNTSATEYLDDGFKMHVSIIFDQDRLTFDFSGTDTVHPGNLNATEAIVNSVVLYILRLLVTENLPLNEGLMKKVQVVLPHCLLNPDFKNLSPPPAVVGGNTEVSQRLTDTLIKALGLAACSQGTMNNVLFGNEHFGYYETICGGTGAGDGFHGQDAVHQHMTNTRITDPEIFEWRYPVRLECFEIRRHSGGNGRWKGGNGATREIFFLEPLEVTILSQHRKEVPYGLEGGTAGLPGEQYLITASGKKEILKGIDHRKVNAGDRLIILTPGGGGYGAS